MYGQRAILNFPVSTGWTPFRKILRLTRKLRAKVKLQWTADRRRQLQYKQTMRETLLPNPVKAPIDQFQPKLIQLISDEALRTVERFKVDARMLPVRPNLYSNNLRRLAELRTMHSI